ncbi:hypothetical protein [Undibacterium umbellatum]|uniref:hypothetical protein n=1 Tax=Undibacterium umbellatum TaxID=2762300 RepID=UPI001C9A2D14|nr:hypothetical protein [Undibacterium umbellatum]
MYKKKIGYAKNCVMRSVGGAPCALYFTIILQAFTSKKPVRLTHAAQQTSLYQALDAGEEFLRERL